MKKRGVSTFACSPPLSSTERLEPFPQLRTLPTVERVALSCIRREEYRALLTATRVQCGAAAVSGGRNGAWWWRGVKPAPSLVGWGEAITLGGV